MELIASLVTKPQGRPTLVLNTDKRQTLDDREECFWDEEDFDAPPAEPVSNDDSDWDDDEI